LRLAHLDMEQQPIVTGAGPHGIGVADPDVRMEIIQCIAKAHLEDRTNREHLASVP